MNFRFADCEIDLALQELRRGGTVVHVEPQVLDLLVHFIRNRNRIVSKDELIDTIWQGRIVSEATLSSRISAARRALGDSGNDQSLIRTVHKRGFRFVGTVTEKLLAYALGRRIEYSDRPAVRKIVRDAAARDYRWSSLILGIVESPAFLMRTSQTVGDRSAGL